MKNYKTQKSQKISSIHRKLEAPKVNETVLMKQDKEIDTTTSRTETSKPIEESVTQHVQTQNNLKIQCETEFAENIEHIDSMKEEMQHVATESEIPEEKVIKPRSPSVIKSPQSAKTSSTEEKTSVEVNHL